MDPLYGRFSMQIILMLLMLVGYHEEEMNPKFCYPHNSSLSMFGYKLMHNLYDCSEILGLLKFDTPRLYSRITFNSFFQRTSNVNVYKNFSLMKIQTQLDYANVNIFKSSFNIYFL